VALSASCCTFSRTVVWRAFSMSASGRMATTLTSMISSPMWPAVRFSLISSFTRSTPVLMAVSRFRVPRTLRACCWVLSVRVFAIWLSGSWRHTPVSGSIEKSILFVAVSGSVQR
jgi:hypothetical protein